MTSQTITTLKYANLQMAAESLFGVLPGSEPGLPRYSTSMDEATLQVGNKHASRFTPTQAEQFATEWKVLEHRSNYKTGFSGTLFECLKDDPAKGLKAGDRVLSFRSTEFIDDAARDNQATNSMEVKELGFAFGQIADMSKWFEELNADSSKLGGGKPFAVTGYSLGGHLATAFNALYGGTGRIKETYTFNGAGVGLVKPGQNLADIISTFDMQRTGNETQIFSSAPVQQLYQTLRSQLVNGARVTQQQIDAASALVVTTFLPAVTNHAKETKLLVEALKRIEKIQNEVDRLTTLSGKDGNPPQEVELKNIEAMNLSYQVAAMRAGEKTQALSVLSGAWLTVSNGRNNVKGSYANFYDVYGATYPSAVSNSQYHYGSPRSVFIEDQPLYRGSVVTDAIKATVFNAFDVKLLVDDYHENDFGDTHSLVLLIDSLSVQSLLAKVDPLLAPGALDELLKRASNKERKTESGTHGKAESDPLENLLNSLADMLDISGWQELKANPSGASWADMDPKGSYTGREQFQKGVVLIEEALAQKNLVPNASGVLVPTVKVRATDASTADQARKDFCAMVALLGMSTVSITAANESQLGLLENAFKNAWLTEYTAWKADRDMSAQDIAAGKLTYTDTYLQARAEMVGYKSLFNAKNLAYDKTLGNIIYQNAIPDPLKVKFGPLPIKGDHIYQDNKEVDGQKLTLDIDGENPFTLQKHRITFGVDSNETLTGGDIEDRLFGGKGDDTLKGQGGHDYLEGNEGIDQLDGGQGKDTLVGGLGADELTGGKESDKLLGGVGADVYKFDLEEAFGHDNIIDADGQGRIEIAGLTSPQLDGSNAKKVAGQEGVWRSDDKKVTYMQVSLSPADTLYNVSPGTTTGLLITFLGKPNDSILIEGWSPSKNLGITFDTTPEVSQIALSFVGDFEKGSTLHPGQTIPWYDYGPTGYSNVGPKPGASDKMFAKDNQGDNLKLEGLGGNDALAGGQGDDWLDGGEAHDYLSGGLGADTLLGGNGDDYIFGSAWHWPVSAGAQSVGLWEDFSSLAPAGAVEYVGGFGWGRYRMADGTQGLVGLTREGKVPWTVNADSDKGNFIDAGAGNDWVEAGTGNDTARGGEGDDIVFGQDLDDVVFGGDGKDQVFGDGTKSEAYLSYVPPSQHGNDVLDGGKGDDVLIGGGRNDQLFGGDGADTLSGDSGGVGGNMFLAGNYHGNDYLDGGEGNDQLSGDGQNDELYGGTGNDLLYGDATTANLQAQYHGKDYLDGEEGDDTLSGGGEADILLGGEGNDTLWGDAGTQALQPGEWGADTLMGGAGNDQLSGGGQADVLNGGDGNDLLQGDGDYVDVASQGADQLDGGAGNDSLMGNGGSDYLMGGAGQDLIEGGLGNDTLEGGAGIDLLKGGAGDDTYVMDALDIIEDTNQNVAEAVDDNEGANTIIFDAGSPVSISVEKSLGAPNAVGLYAGESGLLIKDGAAGVNNTFVLSDGSQYKTNELIGQFADTSASGAFTATAASGGGGALQEFAMAGRGDDVVTTTLDGSTLSGGRGNDTLRGKGAANTYLYAAGDGDDLVQDGSLLGGESGSLGTLGIKGASTVQFGEGITLADITLSAQRSVLGDTVGSPETGNLAISGRYLVVNVGAVGNNAAGRIAIDGFDFDNPNTPLPVATLKFHDGTAVQLADLLASKGVLTKSTTGNDAVQGIWRAETLSGGQGDDTLSGAGGFDTYQWGLGDGQDTIIEHSLSPVVVGGTDTLQLLGSLSPADLRFSRSGDNLLVLSKTTNDRVTVKDHFGEFGTPTRGIDRVVFGNAVVWDRFDINNNLVPEPMTEGDDFYLGTPGNDVVLGLGGNDTLLGLDGNDSLEGNSGDDRLNGGIGNDTLLGGDGTDEVYGDDGDDTLVIAGTGSDRLHGGAGSDTYRISEWSIASAETVVIEEVGAAGADTVELPAGTTLANVLFKRDVQSSGIDQLRISDRNDVSKSIVLERYFWADENQSGVEFVRLGDGTLLDRAQLVQLTQGAPVPTPQDDRLVGYRFDDVIDGGAGNDHIDGRLGNDTLLGGLGNDTLFGNLGNDSLVGGVSDDQLFGSVGNDTLEGGAGRDLLAGAEGSDTYLVGKNSGKDILWVGGTGNDSDRIVFDASILPSQLRLHRLVDDLVIGLDASVPGGDMQLTVSNYFQMFDAAGLPRTDLLNLGDLKRLEFQSNNTVWTPVDIATRVVLPTRTVVTTNGADTLLTSESTGLDPTIEHLTATGSLDLRLVGNAGNNIITGNAGNNSFNGFYNLSDPTAWVNWTTDARPGNTFDSTYNTGFSLAQEGGADTFVGGAGDDTYFVNGGEQAALATGGVNMPPVNGDDVVVELAGEGTDTVVTRNYSETLTANVENLIALNPNTYDLPATATSPAVRYTHVYTGNALNNRIDTYQVFNRTRIDGGAGADTMYGSTRSVDDSTIYVVDNPGDVVIEADETAVTYSLGDRVESSISYTLGAAIEDLTLTGSVAIDGTGNARRNQLLGNEAANVLEGLAGNDTLDGGLGNDIYVYALGDGVDTVQESVLDSSPGKLNVLRLKAGIAPADVDVKQVGNDLEVLVGGEAQKVVVKGFFDGNAVATGNPLQRIEFDNGTAWNVTQIQNLLTSNTPPVLTQPLADVALGQGDNFSIALPTGAFVDADAGDLLTYRLTRADGSPVPSWLNGLNTQTGLITGRAPEDWVGSISLKLSALDKNGAQASDVFEMTVAVENKVVNGTALGETLTGYGGNDSLYGNGGPDTINGNSGNDLLDGGDSYDTLNGGSGVDTLSGGGDRDVLKGDAGNDLLQGGADDDQLTGGLGNDTLDGGLGNDAYLFSKGDGSDVILESITDSTAGKLNTLALELWNLM
jgi:Ca2+-binding RTX toxin-like protein